MRTLLIAALLSSIVFETHELAGQSSNETRTQSKSISSKESKTPNAKGKVAVADEDNEISQNFNLPIKTTGGTQVWTDYAYRSGYRIQKHSLTGHFRLLDEGLWRSMIPMMSKLPGGIVISAMPSGSAQEPSLPM